MNELEMLIAECKDAPQPDVRDALNLVAGRRMQREREVERARAHAEILPKCRAVLDKAIRLRDIEMPAAAERVQDSWTALNSALRHLWAHQANKPDPYATRDEISAYDELTQILEGEAAEARDEKISAEGAQADCQRDFFAASEELGRLQRQEAALRPKIEEHHRTGLLLSGVR